MGLEVTLYMKTKILLAILCINVLFLYIFSVNVASFDSLHFTDAFIPCYLVKETNDDTVKCSACVSNCVFVIQCTVELALVCAWLNLALFYFNKIVFLTRSEIQLGF